MAARRSSARLSRRNPGEQSNESISNTQFEVAIPLQSNPSSIASSDSMSADSSSSPRGSTEHTPMTSTAPTPASSASNAQPRRKRVNASARMQQLQSSSLSLTAGKKRTAEELPQEQSDEALARELQLQEYEATESKRPRLSEPNSNGLLSGPNPRFKDETPNNDLSKGRLSQRAAPVDPPLSPADSFSAIENVDDLDSLSDLSDLGSASEFPDTDSDSDSVDEISRHRGWRSGRRAGWDSDYADMGRSRRVGRIEIIFWWHRRANRSRLGMSGGSLKSSIPRF